LDRPNPDSIVILERDNNSSRSSGGYNDFNKTSTMNMIGNSTAARQHTLTIINGADIIENKSKAIQPSPIIRIKAGDTVTWVNEDRTTHILTAPPGDFSFFSPIQAGQTFEVTLSSTESSLVEDRRVSCTFTEPGGFHYDIDLSNNGIKGVVIVEE
jgi:plastocyanin